ncbi:MAG: hypothetical protein AAGD07_24180 [Planctomycetota bacterium]
MKCIAIEVEGEMQTIGTALAHVVGMVDPQDKEKSSTMPHELFVWLVNEGMPEGECTDFQSQMRWLRKHIHHLRNDVGSSEAVRQRFVDVVPGLSSTSWEDIWERVRERFEEPSNA